MSVPGARGCALLALALALATAAWRPLLLRLPRVGWLLYAVLGGPVPPYFTWEAWEPSELRTWIRAGDLVVAPCTKCGTTWMLYCAHQVRTKGSDAVDYKDVMISSLWPEMIQEPGMTWASMKPLFNSTRLRDGSLLKEHWDNASLPFRIFKSHGSPAQLPVRSFPEVKFLAMVRNGLDVAESLRHFFGEFSEEFRAMWGGFPPKPSEDDALALEESLSTMLPGGLREAMFFGYVKEWWPLRKEKNVLLLHYSDAKRDLRGTVRRIAAFVDVELSAAEEEKVLERCGLEHMKARAPLFNYALPLNAAFEQRGGRIMHGGAMTRRGGLGGSNFTAEQVARWRAAEEAQLSSPGLLQWAREGGPLPD